MLANMKRKGDFSMNKKSKVLLAGAAALALLFALVLTGCPTGSDDPKDGPGSDSSTGPAALNGTWLKDNAADYETFIKELDGTTYLVYGPSNAVWIHIGTLDSYDGTKAVADPHNDDYAIVTFTATFNGGKLTIDGLDGSLEKFNGTYTKTARVTIKNSLTPPAAFKRQVEAEPGD
jgi:hypothetical protein